MTQIRRVLIVEDSPEDATVFKRYLERALDGSEYACEVVDLGALGLEVLRLKQFDCVLLDHNLPDMTGLEFLAALEGTMPCAVVVLTGGGDESLAVAAIQAGAEDYLSKNKITREGLSRSVQSAIEKSELRRALGRDALRRKLLETVAVQANDAIIITDAQPIDHTGPKIIYVNPAFERMTGWSLDEVIGQTTRILLGIASDLKTLEQIRSSMLAWQTIEVEVLNYRKDGTPFWVELSMVPVADASGWYTHWVSIQRDVTARRQSIAALNESQGRYKMLFESMDQSFCMIEMLFDKQDRPYNYRFLEANPIFEQQTGLINVIGKTALDLVPDLESHWIQTYGHVALSGESRRFENGPNSFNRWFEVSAFKFGDAQSRKVAVLFSDITQRKVAELRQLEVNEMQKRFVADVAHELRAPLTSIQGNLEMILRYPEMEPADIADSLGAADRETRRLSRMVSDMLSLARGEAGFSSELRIIRLDEILEQGLQNARLLARGHQLESAQLVPAVVNGNSDRLLQLSLILLENAFKYGSPHGLVHLEMHLEPNWVEFRVFNDGNIAERDLERVFERFYRADQARSPGDDLGGTGLGLPIARSITQQHGGTIRLESILGIGTTVVVRLPLVMDGIN